MRRGLSSGKRVRRLYTYCTVYHDDPFSLRKRYAVHNSVHIHFNGAYAVFTVCAGAVQTRKLPEKNEPPLAHLICLLPYEVIYVYVYTYVCLLFVCIVVCVFLLRRPYFLYIIPFFLSLLFRRPHAPRYFDACFSLCASFSSSV